MAHAARTVRRLRLRAPSEAAVRRTARVLEDALRTASLPDAWGRMLFVRRLELGRLAADAQPMSIALALEEAVARVGTEWRHGEEAGAATAAAVWFRDPLDAHLALAQRVLAGARPEAWYWPLAVPAWHRGMTRAEAVRAIAYSLADRPEAPAALPRWFAGLVGAGHGETLATALGDEDVVPLARVAGLRLAAARPEVAVIFASAAGRPTAAAGATPAAGDSVEARRPAPAGADVIRRLIGAMLRAAGDGGTERGASPFLRGQTPPTAAAIAAPARENQSAGTPAGLPSDTLPGEVGGTDASRTLEVSISGQSAHGPALLSGASDMERIGDDIPRAEVGREEPITTLPSPRPDLAHSPLTRTSAGGLLFLLNALERVGYGEWLTSNPEWASQHVARRVLGRVIERLDIPPDDPGRDIVRVPYSLPATPRRFVAPPRWRPGLMRGNGPLLIATDGDAGRLRDPSGRLLLGAWRGHCPRSLLRDRRDAALSSRPMGELGDEVVGAWTVALRRWIRRFAGLSLSEVVLRPASMTVTPTHLDVHFHLAAADAGIRRAGLDFDPGWVWWFGRVLAFHYDSRGPS